MAASLVGKLPNITGGYAGNFVYKYYQDKGAKQNSLKFSPVGKEDILKSEPGNYRSVSILTVMSKILEKTLHKQLENYLRSEKKYCMFINKVLGILIPPILA